MELSKNSSGTQKKHEFPRGCPLGHLAAIVLIQAMLFK